MDTKYLENIINKEVDQYSWVGNIKKKIKIIDNSIIDNVLFVIDGSEGVGKTTSLEIFKDDFECIDGDLFFNKNKLIKKGKVITFNQKKLKNEIKRKIKSKSVIIVGVLTSKELKKNYYKGHKIIHIANIIDEDFYKNLFENTPKNFKKNDKSSHSIRERLASLIEKKEKETEYRRIPNQKKEKRHSVLRIFQEFKNIYEYKDDFKTDKKTSN